MKVTLVLLMSCLVGLSYQQLRFVAGYWPSNQQQMVNNNQQQLQQLPRSAVAYYRPLFYAGDPYVSPMIYDPLQTEENDMIDGDDAMLIQSRAPLRLLSHQLQQQQQQQERFLFGLFTSKLVAATSIVYSTATSTITSATVFTCIPSFYFQNEMDKTATNTPCRRKKRSDAEFLDSILEASADDQTVSPSKISPIMATEEVGPVKRDYYQPEIVSSRDDFAVSSVADQLIQQQGLGHRPQLRSLKLVVSTVTSTSTLTSYSVQLTTITRLLTIAQEGGYTCSPTDIPICPTK